MHGVTVGAVLVLVGVLVSVGVQVEGTVTSYNATLVVSSGKSCDVRVTEAIEYSFAVPTTGASYFPSTSGSPSVTSLDSQAVDLQPGTGGEYLLTFPATTTKRVRVSYSSSGPLTASLSENTLGWSAVSSGWQELVTNIRVVVTVQSLDSLSEVTFSPPEMAMQVVPAGLQGTLDTAVVSANTGLSVSMDFPVVAKCKSVPVWIYIVIALACAIVLCGIGFCVWRFCCRKKRDDFDMSSSDSSDSSDNEVSLMNKEAEALTPMGGATAGSAVGSGPVINNNGAMMSMNDGDGTGFGNANFAPNNGQGMGMQGQGMGMQGQGMGMQGQGMGMQGQGMGMQGQGMGMQSQGMGMQSQGMGMQSQGMGMQSQGMGMQGQGMGMQSQGMGMGMQQQGSMQGMNTSGSSMYGSNTGMTSMTPMTPMTPMAAPMTPMTPMANQQMYSTGGDPYASIGAPVPYQGGAIEMVSIGPDQPIAPPSDAQVDNMVDELFDV